MKKLISVLLVLVMSACLFVPALAVQSEAAGPKVLDFDVGNDHCGVVDQNGTLWMWGGNYRGQLGNGTDTDVYSPIAVMQGVASVSCGDAFTLALKADGTLWAWGDNTSGQLGNNGGFDKTYEDNYGIKSYGLMMPTQILDDVIAVSAGTFHAAAIRSDYSLWMWGVVKDLGGGVSGNVSTDNVYYQTIPTKIMDNVLSISCGYHDTSIIKTDHSFWNWHYGETPNKLDDGALSVACSLSFHTAIIKADGSLWMFGFGNFGQLGDGIISSEMKSPFKLMDNIMYVSVGKRTTAAVKSDGTLWVWGDNHGRSLIGRDGNDFSENKGMGGVQSVPVQIDGQWRRISMGNELCLAEKSDGSLWAWGSNWHGQIGTGDTDGQVKINYGASIDGSSSGGYYCIVTSPSQVNIPVQGMSAWAGPEVSAAISAGLVPEILQQNYPYPVSRGNVAQMFVNLLEKSSGKTIEQIMAEKGVAINVGAFVDTTDKAVLACNALGIINGVGNNQFSPDGTFTRSQIAAIINRVARVMGVKTDGYTHSFTDVKGHWVDSELGWPVHAGIINGVGDNRFDPDGKLTTEQAIAIAYRALQVLKAN